MKIKMLSAEREFSCLMGDCPDSCCQGWDVIIDDETALRYREADGELWSEIRKTLSTDECGNVCFTLKENGACPHLCSDGLCSIIKAAGEGAIPNICDRHPRYYNLVGEVKEGGLGLSCPAAVSLLMSKSLSELMATAECEKPRIKESEMSISMYSPECDRKILSLRENFFGELKSEKNISEILSMLAWIGDKVIHASDLSDDYEKIFFDETQLNLNERVCLSSLKKQLASAFSSIECRSKAIENEAKYVNKNLQSVIKDLESGADPRLDSIGKKILFCFLHRYMAAGLSDATVGGRIKLSVLLTLMLLALLSSDCDTEDTIRGFSACVEYSEENIDMILDLIYGEL